MKILKQGTLPEPAKASYMGKTAVCESCGARVELEAKDKPTRISRAKTNGGPKFKCPTRGCAGELTLKK